jgi:hypothetical protein
MTFIGNGRVISDSGATLPLWHDTFGGTNIANDRYHLFPLAMVPAQDGRLLDLNPTGTLGTGDSATLSTRRTFPVFGGVYPCSCEIVLQTVGRLAVGPISNWGFGTIIPQNSSIFEGAWFSLFTTGTTPVLSGNVLVNGVTVTKALRTGISAVPADSELHRYRVEVRHDTVNFSIDESPVGSILIGTTSVGAMSLSAPNAFVQCDNSTGTATARRLQVSSMTVYARSVRANKPWAHVMCGAGGHSSTVQPGTASGSTSNYVNSTIPATTTPSNTIAGYQTLGGQFAFNSVAASETDRLLFSYLNAIQSDILAGRTLYITGVCVNEVMVQGAITGAGATVFLWGCGTSTTQSLVTGDGNATYSYRRLALGSQTIPAASAIGALVAGPPRLLLDSAPIVVPPSCRFSVFFKQPLGAATVSLVWRGTVTIFGYFE